MRRNFFVRRMVPTMKEQVDWQRIFNIATSLTGQEQGDQACQNSLLKHYKDLKGPWSNHKDQFSSHKGPWSSHKDPWSAHKDLLSNHEDHWSDRKSRTPLLTKSKHCTGFQVQPGRKGVQGQATSGWSGGSSRSRNAIDLPCRIFQCTNKSTGWKSQFLLPQFNSAFLHNFHYRQSRDSNPW